MALSTTWVFIIGDGACIVCSVPGLRQSTREDERTANVMSFNIAVILCRYAENTEPSLIGILLTDHGSCLMLHTINAQHISSIECEELVLCLTFSTAPEGQSINVIAGGLNNGIVRSV